MGRSYRTRPGKRDPFEFTLDAELDRDGNEIEGTGEHFVCVTEGVSLLELSELASAADVDMESPEGAAAIARIFRTALGPDEYKRFRDHMAKHPDVEVTFEILGDLIGYYTGGPTKRPSPSVPGPPATNGGSPANSPDIAWPGLMDDEAVARIRERLGTGGG